MKTVLINQARMTSTRLPGKVLREVLGRPLLEIQMERLFRCREISTWVIATTTLATDDPIERLCERMGVPCWRGSEGDVLARYEGAALSQGADRVVRVTSDCPLIDPVIVDAIVQEVRETGCDYASNTVDRTYPRGLDAECFTAEALHLACREARLPAEREHVTPFLYRHPERFALRAVKGSRDFSHHRWTVDTPQDFELMRRILEALLPLKPDFLLQDCLDLMEANPDWFQINAAIPQKTV